MTYLSDLIRQVRIEYLDRGAWGVPSFYDINDGWCEDFALKVIERARKADPDVQLVDLSNEELMIGVDGEPDENDVWDWGLLEEHWGTKPPEGLSASDVDALLFGSHVWIAHEGLHYDAECPGGVENLFDLPIFRRVIVEALNDRGIPTPEVITDDIPVMLDGEPVDHPTYAGKAVDFLREIGIPVEWKIGANGFLPHLEIEAGGLLIDPRCPVSNILHEAGHLATVPAEYRHLIGRDVDGGIRQMLDHLSVAGLPPDDPKLRAALQCGDPEATAWAYAAGVHLGIPPELIIMDEEYGGTGADIRLWLAARSYVGINGLQHAGFTAARAMYTWLNLPVYPELAFWLQGGPVPAIEAAPLYERALTI